MENNVIETNKKKNLIIGVVACVIILLIAALVYFLFIKKNDDSDSLKDATKIFISKGSYYVGKEKPQDKEVIAEYICKNNDCMIYKEYVAGISDINENDAVIYDGEYLIYNINNGAIKKLNVPKDNYDYITIDYDSNKQPVALILKKIGNTDENEAIFGIKSNKILVNFDDSYMIEYDESVLDTVGNYYILRYENRIAVYSLADEKVMIEKQYADSVDYNILSRKNGIYLVEHNLSMTGGDASIKRIYSLENKIVYENDDVNNNNYAIVDLEKDELVILDNKLSYAIVYNNQDTQILKSKKYNKMTPYIDDEESYDRYFVNDKKLKIAVEENGKIVKLTLNELLTKSN